MQTELYDVRWEVDHGVAIDLEWRPPRSRTWAGLRVKYRPKGSRGKWRTFLLEGPDGGDVSDDAIAAAIKAHARTRSPMKR